MGVCGCVIPNPNCLCHSTPNYMVTMPKSVLDQIGKEHTEEIERLRLHKDVLLEALQRIANEEDGLNVWSYAQSMVDEFTEKPTAEGE